MIRHDSTMIIMMFSEDVAWALLVGALVLSCSQEQAAETMVSIQKWQRLYGDEMRQRKARMDKVY